MTRSLFFVMAVVTLSLGAVATDASASYNGIVARTVCPSGAFYVTGSSVGAFHPDSLNNTCWVAVSGLRSGAFATGTLGLPFESTVTSNGVAWCLAMNATAAANGSGASIQGQSFDSNGNLFSSGTVASSTGTSLNIQTKCSLSLTVPADGATVGVVQAENNVSLRLATLEWNVQSL